MGDKDDYLDVFVQDMVYSDQPIKKSISEDLADIYQDASVLQQASEEVQDLLATDPEQCEEENINLQHYLEIFFEDQKSRLNL